MNEYFYLAGPMTGYPGYNFDRFREVAAKLRSNGYTIVSPAELDDPRVTLEIMKSETGDSSDINLKYDEFLKRDILICQQEECVGGILLEGWHRSRGALAESWMLEFMEKPLHEYFEDEYGNPILQLLIGRDLALDSYESSHADYARMEL